MRSVIVCISGASRTGKDTLIKHAHEYLFDIGRSGERRNCPKVDYCSVSSIDDVKQFTDAMGAKLGYLIEFNQEPTGRQRQGWADIKRGLDLFMNYSIVLPYALLHREPGKRQIMFYQVREPDNIRELRRLSESDTAGVTPGHTKLLVSKKDGGPAVLWVHVLRPDRDIHTPEATTDQYHKLQMGDPDMIVTNTSVDSLRGWGGMVADLAYHRMTEKPNLQTSASGGMKIENPEAIKA